MKSMPDGLSPFEAKREEDPCGLRPISRQKTGFHAKNGQVCQKLTRFLRRFTVWHSRRSSWLRWRTDFLRRRSFLLGSRTF